MKLEMQINWPQHKVFLLSTLALFPHKLEGQAITLRTDQQYFASQDDEQLISELRYYEKAGYFHFHEVPVLLSDWDPDEPPTRGHRGFVISSIDSSKAANALITLWQQVKIVADSKSQPSQMLRAEPKSITIRSYDADSGTLFFGGKEIAIICQESRRGRATGEPIQASAMRKLFKDVNTLSKGVPLRTIISVRADNFDSAHRKRATNHLDEINRKIEKETGVPKLIIYDQVKYYIDKSYLYNV